MQNLVNEAPVKRNYDFIDHIRCLAMMGIVAEHSFDVGDYIFKTYSANFWVYAMDIQLAKFGTITFFLLAGFLLGDKFTQYTPGQYLQRRIKSTFWPWVIWSLIFFAGLLLRDGVSYLHFGSGGFDFWRYFRDELSLTYLFSNYWFIINFLVCIAILLVFKKNLYNWKLGAALLLCTLFYAVNVHFEWIFPVHTTALFGFVFFLWLGAQFNKNWAVIEGKVKKIPFMVFVIVFIVCFALSMVETRMLFDFKSQEPFNTLRFTNICYTFAIILLAVFQLACFFAYSQNHELDSVNRYLHFTTDKLTWKLTATIKDTITGRTGEGYPYAMVARYSTKEDFFAISFLCKDAGCVKNRAAVDYVFADGKKKSGWHYDGDNCDGYFMALYKSWIGIEPQEVSVFTTDLLNTIRLNGSQIVEVILTKNQSALFRSEMKWLKYYSENWKKINKLNGYDE